MKYYTLWVGGGEVNDHLLTLEEVKILEEEYISRGYLDVVIEIVEVE
jgi:hypothetical protein